MTDNQKAALPDILSRMFFAFGECTFIGVAIGAVVADNPFINRAILAGVGMLLSAVCFAFYAHFELKKVK
jgi:predicted MFS family arabinose efflux permease